VKILIDMNLSPEWTGVFEEQGWTCHHWNNIGDPRAPDTEIMGWAGSNGFVVFTHDLDFGALLAASRASGPSVIQLRSEDTRPEPMANTVIEAINACYEALLSGALVTINPRKMRLSLLPLRPND
jgi:predicted nuclease of predicted toxin-antitoxin system